MTSISLGQVKKLRETTGIGIMACRKALEEVGGDFDRAEAMLKEGAALKAASRGDRETTAGVVSSYIHAGGRVGVLVELCSETDFVSRSPDFQGLAHELAMQICAMRPETVDDLLGEVWVKDSSKKIEDIVNELAVKTKENIVVKRFCRFEVGS